MIYGVMIIMYECRHFKIHELVSQDTYGDRGLLAWELLDWRLLHTIDSLRDKYGPITVNDYFWGGKYEWSGLRDPDSPNYRKYSQHTFGRAVDLKFKNTTPDKVRQDILDNPDDFIYINSVELDTDSWLHIDVRNCKRIKTYKP